MAEPALHERVASWAAQAMGPRAKVSVVTALRPSGSPWMIEVSDGGQTTRAVLKTGGAGMREELATEAAALRHAEANGLPAPLVIASDLIGDEAGCLAVLMTFVDGSDRIPVAADPRRLSAIGAAAGAIHSIPMSPTADLPLRDRPMPWINFSDLRHAGASPTTALLQIGDRLLGELTEPVADTVFVHGDLWAGNLLWKNGECVATIDWEAAGAGSYGVDLGSLRLDAALLHGQEAPQHVLAGWTSRTGLDPGDVFYWDLIAALNTSADMTGATPTMHAAGRADLDGGELTQRRDAFLSEAIAQLS